MEKVGTKPFLSARKPEHVVVFDFLAGLEVLLVTNKKCFKHFTENNNFPDDYDLSNTWLDNGRSCVMETKQGVCFFVLFLRDHSTRVIIHECVHMIHQICDEKGIPLTVDNSETIAYMTDFLTCKVLSILKPDFDF